ncbi:MAG: glutamate-cysteine ligase family protein [Sporichthyaceae bacterium]
MDSQHRARFTELAAEAYVAGVCFKTGPPRAVGIELEWVLHHREDPTRPLSAQDLTLASAAAADLQHSRLTVEPGGQVELSSVPLPDAATCAAAMRSDAAALRAALASCDLVLAGTGVDLHRPPRRLLDSPRYAAMQAYFDASGPAGRTMMCSTAAIQINVDAGPEQPTPGVVDLRTRWALLHEMAPVLVAAFGNSPVAAGRPTGLRSSRHAVWSAIDPARTRSAYRPGEDPRSSWARYALDAPVLCVPGPGPDWSVAAGVPFREWVRSGAFGPVGPEQTDYHLTTLFPPVRPRGHLELRTIDAQRCDDDWTAAFALVCALVEDPVAADAARAALCAVAADPAAGARAARDGLTDPQVAAAARACFDAAHAALHRAGSTGLATVLSRFVARYLDRGRSPADDTLAEFLGTAPSGSSEEAACPAAV